MGMIIDFRMETLTIMVIKIEICTEITTIMDIKNKITTIPDIISQIILVVNILGSLNSMDSIEFNEKCKYNKKLIIIGSTLHQNVA